MPLTSGTKLGPYEIISPLGAGGMGEVYRARDSRLGREVAIKVLPQHLTANPEVRTRFEREAKTVSSLNHPNICTLFDVGREGDTDYLVMELVDGETLAHRLAKGALPPAELLRVGAQIADALDRAHRAGVIHRDLKPGNVMLTRSGAKLMDFGLARATGLAGTGTSGATMMAMTQSPTMAAPLTAEGTIVGTFQYMAPEQLEGKEADARCDLWALGCVLYEMATGRRAFEGPSQASLIGAIMNSEPAPISQIAPLAPPGLDRLVRNCLSKDPEERVQTAHDVKLQLLGISEGSSQSGAAVPALPRRANRERLAWTLAAIAGLALAVAVVLMGRGIGATPKHPVQLSLTGPDGGELSPYSSSMAISPDGQMLGFGAADSTGRPCLWLQTFDQPEPRVLVQGATVFMLTWSPDSRQVAYLDQTDLKLKTLDIRGGTPVTLTDAHSGRGATWNRHGDLLFAPVAQGTLYRIPASGGEPVQATWLDSTRHEAAHRFPCFLPDGDHFLYASLPSGPEGFDIMVGSLHDRSAKKLLTAQSAATYAAPGYVLFVRDGKVMGQRFDAARRVLTGNPVALGDAAGPTDLDADRMISASDNGRLVFLVEHPPNTQLQWVSRTGTPLSTLPLASGPWQAPVLSPDDRFAIVPNGNDLWRVDLARSVATRLTSNGAANADPIWSPDGSQIAFTMGHLGREEIEVINADGSGDAKLVPTTDHLFKAPMDWSAQGLIFTDIGPHTFRDLWIVPMAAEAQARPLIMTQFSENRARVSPDGHWVAYLSDEAGKPDVYIQSFPVVGHKVRVSTHGAQGVGWMPGSDAVTFASSSGLMLAQLRHRGEDLEVMEPQKLFDPIDGVVGGDMAHDGQRILISLAKPGAGQRRLRVILDWPELMQRP